MPNEMTFDHLARKIKDAAFFRQAQRLYDDERLKRAFESGDRESFERYLTETLDRIKIGTQVRKSIGKTFSEIKRDHYDEYLERKAGKSHKRWLTPFNALNDVIGGLFSSDVYGIMAERGHGKTYLTLAFVDCLLRQGANVLVKSFELRGYNLVSRLFSIMSANDEAFVKDGQTVGIPNKSLLAGKLDAETEAYYAEMLDRLNEYYDGEIYLQAKGDADLTRTLDGLEKELAQQPNIDVVVLDPFYGLDDVRDGRKNANKVAGGSSEAAARRFEVIVGNYDVVGLFTVQARVDKRDQPEDGPRELKLPTGDKVKTSTALPEIATNMFTFDSNDGEALLGIDKGRNGGEGFTLSLLALLDYGVLREFPSGEELPF